jgi:hypothetical protein
MMKKMILSELNVVVLDYLETELVKMMMIIKG